MDDVVLGNVADARVGGGTSIDSKAVCSSANSRENIFLGWIGPKSPDAIRCAVLSRYPTACTRRLVRISAINSQLATAPNRITRLRDHSEVVEARQDTTVVLHPLADYRRQLPIERLGVTLDAAPEFGLVVSYNPGYQSVLKDLKDSTRQRMVAIEFGFPAPDIEEGIVAHEAGVGRTTAAELVRFGQAIRRLETGGLREVASTRVLIAAGRLIADGLTHRDAAIAEMRAALNDLLREASAITPFQRPLLVNPGQLHPRRDRPLLQPNRRRQRLRKVHTQP